MTEKIIGNNGKTWASVAGIAIMVTVMAAIVRPITLQIKNAQNEIAALRVKAMKIICTTAKS